MRKLATIRKVHSIEAISGADAIEVAKIDGWQCVVKKGEFKVGSLGLYFEIDSFLPVLPEFEFLRKSSYKKIEGYGEGFRLKTIKLRGTLSQGLLLPLFGPTGVAHLIAEPENVCNRPYPVWVEKATEDGWYICEDWPEIYDIDFSEIIGVRLYDPPLNSAQMSGVAKGNFPSFIRKTDSERIQNLGRTVEEKFLEQMFEVTVKLDGSSMTVYCNKGEVGVCSRNYDLKEDETNTFWSTAKKEGLTEGLLEFCTRFKRNLAIQGELMGPGIQGNQEQLTEHQFYMFRIWDIDKQEYLPYREFVTVANEMRLEIAKLKYLRMVPFLGLYKPKDVLKENMNLVDSILTFSDGPSINTNAMREGLVWKHVDSEFNFKAISNKWLLNEK